MRPRSCLSFAVALGAAVLFAAAAMAGELEKEGSYTVTYFKDGTFKDNPVGNNLHLDVWDEVGQSVGTGLLDHMTWHCFGVKQVLNGISETPHGYCVGTDLHGDQIAFVVASERYAANAATHRGLGTSITSTGKYAGISADYTFACEDEGAPLHIDGTLERYRHKCTIQGSYKFP